MKPTTTVNTYPFLAGGGELGELTRQYDWQRTSLGAPHQWAQSLRTTLSIILNTKSPMFLWWGPELIQFYNDAYRPSLGNNGKHPTALGQKGADCWPEIWPTIKPMIDQVLGGGEPTWHQDQLIPINRNGQLEQVYWTFGYSAVNDESGQPAGVLVICTETTNAVADRNKLKASEARFRSIVEQAPVAVALFTGPEFVIALANDRVLEFWGRSREQVINKPLFEALPESGGQGFEELLQGVYTTGDRFVAHERPVTLERNGRLESTYIDFVYDPYYEPNGIISGIIVQCVEITQQVLARQVIEESEAKFRTLIEQAPMAIGLFKGRDMVIDVGNNRIFDVWDKDPSVIGLPVMEVLPEIAGQGYMELLEGVYDSGEPFAGDNLLVSLNRHGRLEDVYFDLLYTPLRGPSGAITGVMVLANEVTERVLSRQKMEQSDQRESLLLKLSDALRPLAHPVDIQTTATRMTREHFQADRCYYGEIQNGQAIIGQDAVGGNHPSLAGVYELAGMPILASVIDAGKPFIVYDIHTTDLVDESLRQVCRQLQLISFMALPVIKEGKPVGILCVVQNRPRPWTAFEVSLAVDIAERTWAAVQRSRVDEAQCQSEQKYRALFESMEEGYVVCEVLFDQDQNPVDLLYLEANAAAVRLTGVELVGKTTRQLNPGYEQYWFDTFGRVARTGISERHEFLASPLGSWYNFSVFKVNESSHTQVAAVYEDITARKKAQEALQIANRRKDEFLAMLAHELRNPMAILHNILLLLNLTQGQDDSMPFAKAVTIMMREVSHLSRMTDDLLDVSRISLGKVHLQKERIELGELVRDALAAFDPQFNSRQQVLTLDLAKEPVWVEGDRMRLTQVLRNLLNNAVKYTPNGGQIEVTLTIERHQAMLRVRDNGIGLSSEQAQTVFDLFVQVASRPDQPQGGLGVGLTVVKQLVELHGGNVTVHSPGLGKGSEFIVRLPGQPAIPLPGQQTSASDSSHKNSQRVLIVDDNADLALTTALLLRLKKYEAHTRFSGSEALEAVESVQPEVVLLDLGMPGMDGYETCRRLRELPWGRDGVIVALSGYGQEEDKKRTRAAGFNAHLVKPVDLTTLTVLLTQLLAVKGGKIIS